MVRRTPPSDRVLSRTRALPGLCPAPVPPVFAEQEQDARSLRRLSGCPRGLVQQMQEQPGGERGTGAVLDYDLPRASNLELAEKTSRCRPDHRLQRFEASGSGGVAAMGGHHRRRRSVNLDLLLDGRAPAEGAKNGQYINHLVSHGTPLKVEVGQLDRS